MRRIHADCFSKRRECPLDLTQSLAGLSKAEMVLGPVWR